MARKKVLLTGGTSGIGLEALKQLIEADYEVHITYRRSKDVAEEYEGKYPDQVFSYQLDQGKAEEIEAADWLTEHDWYGVVFNAALGSGTVLDYSKESSTDEFVMDQTMMNVNALGPLFIYKKIFPQIKKRTEKTKLIFMSSVGGGLTTFPNMTISDGMSKAAVTTMARQIAAENIYTKIDVFSVCPGAVETPMFISSTLSKLNDEELKKFTEQQPKKRLIQPEEVAELILYLLEDGSTLLHGANIDATLGLASRPGVQTEFEF